MRRWVVIGLICTGILVSYLDRGNLSLAVVPIMREFGYSPAIMGALLSSFFWTYAIFQVPIGALIDRFGIRRIYAGGFLVWSLASAGVGLSYGLTGFLTARLILGLAEPVAPLASLSYIRRNFAAKEQALPTSIYFAGANLGPAAGTLLGAYLLSSFGWRLMFIATGLGALIWLLPWLIFAPTDQPAPAAATSSEAIQPKWPVVLANPVFWAMTAFVFLYSYFWYFVLSWMPAYLILVHKYNTIEMGRVLSIPLFVMAVLGVVAGAAADRIARWTGKVYDVRLWFSCVGMAGASAVLLLLIIPDRRWVLPVLMVSACSTGVASTNFWALAQSLVPSQMVGRSMGYLNTIAQIAGVAAPLITGFLLGPSQKFTVALFVAGGCPLLAALALGVVGTMRLQTFHRVLDSSIDTAPAPAAT